MSSSDHQMAEAPLLQVQHAEQSSCKARTTCPDLGSNLEAGSAKRREREDARKRKDMPIYTYIYMIPVRGSLPPP